MRRYAQEKSVGRRDVLLDFVLPCDYGFTSYGTAIDCTITKYE